jgi:hypothetical protein
MDGGDFFSFFEFAAGVITDDEVIEFAANAAE